ncbi:MAG: hypothetical protein OEY03_06250 [Rhizobacter sp.]|nr:hypothetical protein [Rhizobacter sp.]
MTLIRSVCIATALALAPLAWAHDDATLDTFKSPNGGQLRAAGEFHFELVVAPASAEARPAPVVLYVTDHAGGKVATAGASGTVTLLSGAQKTSIALQPDGENRLKGSGTYRSAADLKAIVAVTVAGKTTEQARFTPLAKAQPN